jgi:hypothetical protein
MYHQPDSAWVWDVRNPSDPRVVRRFPCRADAQTWIEDQAAAGSDVSGWDIVENDDGE